MAWTEERLKRIYSRTQGKCHICGKKLVLRNYGKRGERAAWSVDHSKPQAGGGTHHGNNLYPACLSCNSNKGSKSSRAARSEHGRSHAPLSKRAEGRARSANATVGAFAGFAVGAAAANPLVALVAGAIGAFLGKSIDPEQGAKR